MANKLPPAGNKNSILIVCEGAEESDYVDRLKDCGVWSNRFSVQSKNAKSINNIFAMYSYYYQANNHKLIVIFCDTEKFPYNQFIAMRQKIDKFHGKRVADRVVFFVNPCSLQVVLLHFEAVRLISNSKTDNAATVERLTGVKDYKATAQQRKSIVSKITAKNYIEMEQRLAQLKDKYSDVPSSNILQLFTALDMGDLKWISSINQKIEK